MKNRQTFWFLLVMLLWVPLSAWGMEIHIWDFPRWLEPGETVDRCAWIKRQIAEFEKNHPGVQVKLTELSWSRGDERLKIAALGGPFPDNATGGTTAAVPLVVVVLLFSRYLLEGMRSGAIT